MFHLAFSIASKDLKLVFRGGTVLVHSILLGLVLIFIFSFSLQPGESISQYASAALFWLCSLFCQILVCNHLYSLEDKNSARIFLNLYAHPAAGIWLGKTITTLLLLLLSQLCYYPAILIFLQQFPGNGLFWAGLSIMICDIGICSLGSLLGAACQDAGGKDALLSVFLFPLLTPLLLSAVYCGSGAFGESEANIQVWLGIAVSFDAIYIGCALLLFGFLYQDQ